MTGQYAANRADNPRHHAGAATATATIVPEWTRAGRRVNGAVNRSRRLLCAVAHIP